MFLPGTRKKRSHRGAALGPTSRLVTWLPRLFWDRKVLVPVALTLAAICALVAAVEGWKTSFPYRVGERADADIAARLDFKRLNRTATEKAKAEAADRVARVFIHDPDKLNNLETRFESSLREISNAESLDNVRPATRMAFGLTGANQPTPAPSPNGAKKRPGRAQQDFTILKNAASGEDATSGRTIDTLLGEFRRFIAPLKRVGRADSVQLQNMDLPPGTSITVRTPKNDTVITGILVEDVQLEKAMEETGLLGKHWGEFSELFGIRRMVQSWLLAETPVTLRFDPEMTQLARREARDETPPVYDAYEENQQLVKVDEIITEEAFALLRAEYEAHEKTIPSIQRIGRVATVFAMFTVLAILVGYYIVHNEPKIVKSPGRLAVYLAAVVLAVISGRLLATGSWRAEVIPLTAVVMVLAIAYNQRLATITALALALIIALSTSSQLTHFVILMSVAATAIIPLSHIPSRSMLIKVGFWSAAVYFAIAWGTGIIENQTADGAWSDLNLLMTSLKGAGCCLVAGYLVAGSLPFVESAFGIVTDISLLEMSDVSHPLLQELVRRAPGTYNHSMTVASIGETAADAIGANGLLVRVGAYFHDIGKMLKPEYFIENMTAGMESRHEHLAPAMSTLIIIGHVKDGTDLAEQHNLPQRLIDFIEQHHGTTLVEYFFHAASKQAREQSDHKTDAEEASFRYPGPKPQSKETGVMMLADAVESASRTLNEPTPKRIDNLVEQITMKRLLDGQFDESTLTLSEIRKVQESLKKSLIGIYHGRIKYPEQRSA